MAKAGLPKAQSPEDAKPRPPERHPIRRHALRWHFLQGRRNLRDMERCPVRAIEEMSRTPKSRSDVRQGRTRDQPSRRESQGDGVPIVVVGDSDPPRGAGEPSTGPATRGRTYMSEHVDWRFDEIPRRSSGSVLRAWPRPDVRRRRPRRGSKDQAKAQGRPFHPGATGERQIGRVKKLNLWLMSREDELRRWDALAEYRDWPLRSGRRRLRSPLNREEHRRPRATGGTHPGRSSCARNAVTPVGVRCCLAGRS